MKIKLLVKKTNLVVFFNAKKNATITKGYAFIARQFESKKVSALKSREKLQLLILLQSDTGGSIENIESSSKYLKSTSTRATRLTVTVPYQ